MSDAKIWGIHAGRSGDAHTLFLDKNVVALGWVEIGDLTKIPANRSSFKDEVTRNLPHIKPGAIPGSAGQLFRFVHEMKQGDYVVYPSKHNRQVNIGQIVGDYFYAISSKDSYPHQRKVRWLKSLPRTSFTQGALYEIGSAMSFFQLKNYAEEFLYAIKEKAVKATPIKEDETVAPVSSDIEENTKDFIIKTISQELKGHPFAEFVAHLLNCMGYQTRVSPEGPDGGIDIIAHKDELGFEPPIIKVQVKSTDGNIGDPLVSALYGKVSTTEYGLLVTLGGFTNQALNFAKSKSNLRLINGDEFIDLVLAHYEQLDSYYKGIIPLKKVYVPEPANTF